MAKEEWVAWSGKVSAQLVGKGLQGFESEIERSLWKNSLLLYSGWEA